MFVSFFDPSLRFHSSGTNNSGSHAPVPVLVTNFCWCHWKHLMKLAHCISHKPTIIHMEEPPTPCRKRPCWFSLYSYILDLSFFLAAGISVQVILTEWQLFNLVPLIRSCRHNLHTTVHLVWAFIFPVQMLHIFDHKLLGSCPALVIGNNFYSSASNQISFTLSLSGTLWQRLYANEKNI